MTKRNGPTPNEIRATFDTEEMRELYPPILTIDHVIDMLGYADSTIYEWIKKGRFDGAFRKRGKQIRLWRDKVIEIFFDGPEWESSHET